MALRAEWARDLNRPPAAQAQASMALFVFRLGAEHFAIDVGAVGEIVRPPVIRQIPHGRNGVARGITNVRGQITLCIHVERILGVSLTPSSEQLQSRLVVFRSGPWRLGAIVDEAVGVIRFDPSLARALPETCGNEASSPSVALIEFAGRVVTSLDTIRFFTAVRKGLR